VYSLSGLQLCIAFITVSQQELPAVVGDRGQVLVSGHVSAFVHGVVHRL